MITIKIGGSVVDDLHQSTISDIKKIAETEGIIICLLYTSPSPRDRTRSRMPSSA